MNTQENSSKGQEVDFDFDTWDVKQEQPNTVIQTGNPLKNTGDIDQTWLDDPFSDSSTKSSESTGEKTTTLSASDDSADKLLEEVNNDGYIDEDTNPWLKVIKDKIEKEEFMVFDDFDENKESIDQYLNRLKPEDVQELLDANFNKTAEAVQYNTYGQLIESLPPELQYAIKYVSDGGQDVRTILKAISDVDDVKNMDISDPDNQQAVAYNYLKVTNFGTDDEIADQIKEWEDLGTLEKRVNGFKPKLDAMYEQRVQMELQAVEEQRQQQEQIAQMYMENVYNVLSEGKLGDVNIDPKTQEMIYYGLTSPEFQSITGKPVNHFGHLLEEFQYVNPTPENYERVMGAYWYMMDPEGFKRSLVQSAVNDNNEKIARELKTVSQRQLSNNAGNQYEDHSSSPRINKMPKKTGLFSRPND